MQFRSNKRRGVAAFASTALAAGVLAAVPVAMIAAPAQAASGPITYTCNLGLTGGFASYGGDRAATLTFDTDTAEVAVGDSVKPKMTTTLTLDPAYAALFTDSPVNRFGGTLTAATATNSTAGTSEITFAQWDRVGAMGTPVSSVGLSGSGSWSAIAPTATGDITLGVGVLTGTLFMGTSFSPANTSIPTTCTPTAGATTVTTVDTVSAVVKDVGFACTFSGSPFSFFTNVELAATQSAAGKVSVTAGLENMPNTAPSFISLPNQKFVATLGTNLGDFTGSHNADFQGGVPVVMPDMAGKVTSSANPVSISVEDLTVTVGNAGTVECTLATPKSFTVDVAPKPQVCIDAETALTKAQAAVAPATAAASGATAAVKAASSKASSASSKSKAADKKVTKANASVKKATKAAKKAKTKKAKTKAKKAVSKAKKAASSAKKAASKAKSALKTANAQLASAKGKSAAANAKLASAKSAVTAAQNALNTKC